MQNNEFVNIRSSSREQIAEGIGGRFLLLENGRLEFVIIIDDSTLHKHYRDAWMEIDRARFFIRNSQGTDLEVSSKTVEALHNNFKYELLNLKDTKYSYGKIAKLINFDLLVHLLRLSDENENNNKKKTAVRTTLINTFFDIFKVKTDDQLVWIEEGLYRIKLGKAPWSLEKGPIQPWKVRDAIRQWKKDIISKKVVYIDESIDSLINQFRIRAFQDGFYEDAVKLLEKTFPDSYKKNLKIIDDHIIDILSSLEKPI